MGLSVLGAVAGMASTWQILFTKLPSQVVFVPKSVPLLRRSSLKNILCRSTSTLVSPLLSKGTGKSGAWLLAPKGYGRHDSAVTGAWWYCMCAGVPSHSSGSIQYWPANKQNLDATWHSGITHHVREQRLPVIGVQTFDRKRRFLYTGIKPTSVRCIV